MTRLPMRARPYVPDTQPKHQTDTCCARCRRGTRALPGGCAYLTVGRYCPNQACAHSQPAQQPRVGQPDLDRVMERITTRENSRDELRERARQLRTEGLTARQIGARLGVPAHRIYKAWKDAA